MATQVGTAVIKLEFDGKSLSASLSDQATAIKSAGTKSGKGFATSLAVAAGNLIADGMKKVGSIITNSMDSAMSRVDTLNNFPKVMQSLGYSSEEATSSIQTMSDKLDGLPTSLDGMSADVQKLAATMGNLNEGAVNATTVGLGLNNMFLAGGKGTAAASAAMEQYNQMLARGKVDMQSWNSLVNAAPGQMDQLAKSILGANANQQDLYQAMQSGQVSFDQLNEKIVQLNEEGGENFSSFTDQAIAATGGLQTQMQNIATSLTKVVAAAMEGNTDAMAKGLDQLVQRIGDFAPKMIQAFVTAFNGLVSKFPELFQMLVPPLVMGVVSIIQNLALTLLNSLPTIINTIISMIPAFMEACKQFLQSFIQALPQVLPQILQGITDLIIAVALMLTDPEMLSLILQAAITLLMSLVKCIPQIIVSLIQALPDIIMNIVKFLTDPNNIQMIIQGAVELFFGLVKAVPQIIGALIGAFGELVGKLWDWITNKFRDFAAGFGETIGRVFKNAINGVLTFIENFINGPIDLINGAIDIINNIPGVDLGHVPRIQLGRLAEGGAASQATAAIFGEAGTEVVLPLERNQDNWAGLLAGTLAKEMSMREVGPGKTINVYMTNEINNEMDAEDIGRKLMTSIRRAA